MAIFFLGWRECNKLNKAYKDDASLKWVADLARMIKVSLLAYFSGAAFLSLAYFDLPWHLVAIVVLLKEIARKQQQTVQNSGAERPYNDRALQF